MSKQAMATLLVSIGADIGGLVTGTKQASSALDSIGSKAAQVGKKVAVMGAAAVAAGDDRGD
jgi:hypothetical protein